jgi:hypothetical protein
MWIVVIYVCLVGGVCMFIDSPPVYSKQDCEAIKIDSEKMLDNDPRVVIYDNTCVHVKMNQVGELR